MRVDCSPNVGHASIRNFHSAAIENFMESVVFRKMGIQKLKELPTYVCLHCLAKWRIIPYNFPCSVSSSSALLRIVPKFMIVAALP